MARSLTVWPTLHKSDKLVLFIFNGSFLPFNNTQLSLNFVRPILVGAVTAASLPPLAFILSLSSKNSSLAPPGQKMLNSSAGETIPFIASTHLSQIKPCARVEVTLFICAHLPCTHLSHFVRSTEFAIILQPHFAHGSTLLLIVSFFRTTFTIWSS